MKLSLVDHLLWAGGFLSSAILLAIVFRRGGWKQFPVFTAWIGFVTAKTILCYSVYRLCGRGHLYAQVYWLSLWPEFALQMGTVVELARAALRHDGKWVGDARRVIWYAAIFGTAISALLCEWIMPPRGAYASWELRADLFTSLIFCELLVSIGLNVNSLRLAWDARVLSVTEGLTAFSLVSLIVNALQSYLGSRDFLLINRFQSFAWIGAMVWIAIDFAAPHPAPEAPQPAVESSQVSARNSSGKPRALDKARFIPLRKPLVPGAGRRRAAASSLVATHSIDGAAR